jgi:hypothetical protein
MPGGGKGGGGTSTVNVNNSGTTQVLSDSTLEIVGLNNIHSTSRTELAITEPIRSETNSRTELAITEPIRSESDSAIALDIRPVTADLCLNLNIGKIPPTCIRQPYQQHFGITLFGIELLGFNIMGESRIVVEPPSARPLVAWGGEQAVTRSQAKPAAVESEPGGGLRIRLGK